MPHTYQVIVGNIGTVYDGDNGFDARRTFMSYVKDSGAKYGRASGEPVTLMRDGEPVEEHSVEEPWLTMGFGAWAERDTQEWLAERRAQQVKLRAEAQQQE